MDMLKKIGALLLALAMVMSLAAALAAETIPEEGYVSNTVPKNGDTITSIGRSVTFTDTFTISTDDKASNLPAATFNYTIAPGTAVDASDTSPMINAGVTGATITAAEHAATASGTTEDSVLVTVDFSNVNFTKAGIYRYNVTETLGDSNVRNDIKIDTESDNKDGKYFLDVYVTKKADGTFEPYAYVLAKSTVTTQYDNTKDPQSVTYTGKTGEITNEYTTYDLTVKKYINGSVAANSFYFTIDLSNVPTDVVFKQDTTDNTGASSYTLTATLSNGEGTVIYGLPSTVGYAVKETVNSLEGYSVTVSDNNPNATGEYDWIGTGTFGKTASTTMGTKTMTTTVEFTNTLTNISPTGVVLRVAPFVLILGAGVALLLISRRRKAASED